MEAHCDIPPKMPVHGSVVSPDVNLSSSKSSNTTTFTGTFVTCTEVDCGGMAVSSSFPGRFCWLGSSGEPPQYRSISSTMSSNHFSNVVSSSEWPSRTIGSGGSSVPGESSSVFWVGILEELDEGSWDDGDVDLGLLVDVKLEEWSDHGR